MKVKDLSKFPCFQHQTNLGKKETALEALRNKTIYEIGELKIPEKKQNINITEFEKEMSKKDIIDLQKLTLSLDLIGQYFPERLFVQLNLHKYRRSIKNIIIYEHDRI